MRYAKIRNSDGEIVEVKKFEDSFDPSRLTHKFGASSEFKLVPVEEQKDPTFDPDTQYLGPRLRTVTGDKLIISRAVLTLSQEDQNQRTEVKTMRNLIIKLRDGTATDRQTKRAVAYCLKQLI